ncbi:hypothetical protein HOE04_01840 [archaeon]|nr:hypothetical protein [archaeon]
MTDKFIGRRIEERELGKVLEGDSAAELVLEGKLPFADACKEYGRENIVALIYAQQKVQYGGGLRAISMMRRSSLYEGDSF